MNELFRAAYIIARKDLRSELRTREILLTMCYFGLLVVLIFSFAFQAHESGKRMPAVASGIIWVSLAFAGSLGLSRAFDREREADCIRALLLTPVPRNAIYLGKVTGMILFMAVLEALVVPGVLFFFSRYLQVGADRVAQLFLVVTLGTVGYASVGTLFAASLLHARSRDILLTIMFFPIIIPLLLAGVGATGLLFAPVLNAAELAIWMKVLAAFDLVFITISLWVFETLILD